jgi:DNA ligase-associated metallophosphoesterase
MRSVAFKLADEEFIFDYRRVIYWPKRKMLIAADLHWGKTAYLQKHGIAVSDRVLDNDLFRLTEVLKDYSVESFLVLGDLIHHERSLNRGIIQKIADFRNAQPCELILLKGNHDKFAHFPESWGIIEEHEFYIDRFLFHHEPHLTNEYFQFSGHLHPMFKIKSGVDLIRLPAFIIGSEFCYLPAFSQLTGGQDIRLLEKQKAVVVFDEGLEVFEK